MKAKQRESYKFAVRDRYIDRTCHVCKATIPSHNKNYLTFASLEGDPKNFFCCEKKDCIDEILKQYENEELGFRIPLQTHIIDAITSHKIRRGLLSIGLSIAVIVIGIPLILGLFVLGSVTDAILLLVFLILVILIGIPSYKEASPLLWKVPVGYVFLSWTVHNPRDNAVMRSVMEKLERFKVEFYDYTKFQVDDTADNSDEIRQLLDKSIRNSDCSVEIISQEIIFHDWVQYERGLLRERNRKRIFLCTDLTFLTRVGKNEESIIRLNFSDGRFGGDIREDMARHDDVSHFQSKTFRWRCTILAIGIRFGILTGSWWLLRKLAPKPPI